MLVLLFAAMAALEPDHDAWEIGMIAALGVLQLLESKIPFVSTTPGKVIWILLKLAIAYLLIGYTRRRYQHLLSDPAAAHHFRGHRARRLFPRSLFSLLACAAYLSFLDCTSIGHQSEIEPDQVRDA